MQGHRTRAGLTGSGARRFGGAAAIAMVLAAGSLHPLGEAAAQSVVAPPPPAPVPAPTPIAPPSAAPLPVAPPVMLAPAAAYPAKEVLDAFRTACSKLTNLGSAERRVAAAGWSKVADPATTPIGGLMRFSETAAADFVKKAGGKMRPSAVFERDVAGERLYIVLSGVTVEGRTVNGCRLYDADESRSITPATVTAWIGREPVQAVDQPALMRTTWEPGMAKGQDSFELSHIANASPLLGVPQVAGIALKADQVTGA